MSFNASNKDLVLLPKSLILVTGASGFIASHIVQEALNAGFRVRGTARSIEKAKETHNVFSNNVNYESVVVPDMAAPDAFVSAINGCDAVIHVASVVSFSPDPHQVVPQTVAGVLNMLKAAHLESSVKRFVFTSSSVAATMPDPGVVAHLHENTWNEHTEKIAWADPPYKDERAFDVYAASKIASERAAWDFIRTTNPQFVFNAVLPNTNFGKILSNPGPTGSLVIDVYRGITPQFPPQWMINVTDDARIHLAAVLDGTLTSRRIYAFASPYNWNDVLKAVKKVQPVAQLPDSFPDMGNDLMKPDNELGAHLLEKWWGQQGYTSLLESVRQNLEGTA